MKFLPKLFENNRRWATDRTLKDPRYFERLSGVQNPDYLWIGCSDSRVPAEDIVGAAPGELFVHRNIANLVPQSDSNVLSVLQYAVDVLRVGHIIVCGHFGCGGIQAALQMRTSPPLKNWLEYVCQIYRRHQKEIDALPDEEARWTHMCELNVAAQVQALRGTEIVQAAWKRNQPLVVHGWIYDLHSGLLHDLDLSVDAPQASRPIA